MSNIKIVREKFNCPVLGAMANIETTYRVKDSSHRLQPSPPQQVGIKFHCHDCFACGVATPRTESSFSYKWEICPAHFNKRANR
jgi:hypothetical protein